MANLTNRLALEGKASSLDGILAEVAGWLDQYHVLDASALVKCCTQIHDRMREEIQGPTAGYISDLCTATNCVLLDHILRLLVRLQPQFADLVCLVRDELYESIFVTPPESCRDFLAADGAAPSPAALSVPDAQLRAAKMAAHGDGLWASKAKLLASTHTAHSRLRDSASDGGSQAAFAAKAFGMWRFVAVTQRKFREHDRAQAMLQNRFDTMEVLYKTEQAATRDLEGKVAYLNSRIEELELELNMKQKDYDLLHKRMRAESVRLQAELEVMRTELADKAVMSTTKARRTTLSLIHQRDRAYGQMEKVLAYLERWLQGPEPPTHLAGLAAKSAEMVNASAPTEQSVLKWLNAVLDRAHGIWPTNRKLKSLDDPHLLKGVVAVLEVLAPETVHFDPNSNRVHTARMSMLESEYLENLDHKAIARLISESLGELGVPLGALTEQDLATGTISPKLLLFPLAFLFECFCRPEKEAPVPNIIFEDVQLADEPRTAAQWWDVLYPTLLAVREQDAACRQLVNGGAQAVVRELADNSDLDNFRGTKHVFLPRYTRLSTDDLNGVLSINPRKDLRQILDVVLHRAYRFHAHSEDLAQGMDFGQFMRFCVQAKIVEPGVVDRTHLHRIFNAAAGHSPGDEGECRRHLRMGPTEWVQALVRMAFLKYAEEDAGLAIAARLELLIERCVAVHCAYPERGSQLFQTIRSVEIQQVIDKYRDLLTDVFNRYCTGAAYPPQLHEGEWKLLLMNCSLVDSTFTHNAVSQVFQHAQDVDDTEDCDQTMMLPEFLDGLVLVAMFKHPAPYVSLAERLDQFLVVNVLVPLRFKFEWESPELNAAAVRYNIVALR